MHYKDSSFRLLFKHEKYAVDLYEFLTDNRLDPTTIRSVRLEDGLLKSPLYNDASFLTENDELLVLTEHQSTKNKSMAFRLLECYMLLVNKYIKVEELDKYGTKLIHIPKAQFFVVYNGKCEPPTTLKGRGFL